MFSESKSERLPQVLSEIEKFTSGLKWKVKVKGYPQTFSESAR